VTLTSELSPSAAGRPLVGKVAVVTGASRGIGKGCAFELAAAGSIVYVTGRTAEEGTGSRPGSLAATVAEIADAGGRAVAVRCDHSDDADVERLFSRVLTEESRIDVLVNNAFAAPERIDPSVPFWETPIADWDAMIDVGTRSAYVSSHNAARAMVVEKRGLIVNVSSAGAVRFFHHLAYGVGKAALDRFTRDAARPLALHDIAIVSLWPFLVRTETVVQLPWVDLAETESPRFCGRGVVALAADPDVLRWTGRALTTRAVANEYRFTDVDGVLPPEQPWRPPV
jgi:dehydrogenase/reductase SDR family member 1